MAATPPPGYTPPPADLPQRGDRATFSDRVDAWVTWFSTVILTQLAAIVANAYANALDAAASATSALGYRDAAQTARDAAIAARDLAQGYRDTALTYRNGAEAARDAAQGYRDQASATATAIDKRYLGAKATAPTLDNQGAALTVGAWYFDTALNRQRVWNGTTWVDGLYGTSGVTSLNSQVGVLTLKTINGTDLVGAGDIITRTTAPVENRASNTQIVGADRGKWLRLSATFTQTFATAATLTDGWTCFITNSGTGEITMPDVDGWGGTWKMYPGETRLFISDGTSLRTIIIESFRFFSQISGTFAKAPGYRYFDTALSGGGGAGSGGGGGGSGNGAYTLTGGGGSGGGGGASGRTAPIVRARLKASVLPASIVFLLGAGGVGGVKGNGGAGAIANGSGNNGTNGAVGSAGGASTFGSMAAPASYLTVGGGLNASAVGTAGRGSVNSSQAPGQAGAAALADDTTTVLVWTGATQYPVPAGSAGFASANAPTSTTTYGAASAGGNGATSGESSFASLTAPTVGGVAPAAAAASIGVPGGNASTAPQAGPGAGGAGGAGGSGSTGVGSGASAAVPTGKGGDGSNGGNGGDGFVEILGVI